MQNIEVTVEDKPGELARIADTLAVAKVNIISISTDRHEDGTTTLRMVTDDLERAAAVLKKAKVEYRLTALLTVTLPDQPGQLARVAKQLAQAGVNIEHLYLVDKVSGKRTIALVTDDDEKADSAVR